MNKKQIVYLDMDGTIADLYNCQNWLARLRSEEKGLFAECKPLTTEEHIYTLFNKKDYDVRICSMTPKGASSEYCLASH